jgi:hypothetical protein
LKQRKEFKREEIQVEREASRARRLKQREEL